MPHQIEKKIQVKVPANKLWQVMSDFCSVENYALTIKASPIINDIHSGLGAKRLCTFNDGTTLVEEIVEYDEGRRMKIVLSEYSMPLKSMSVEMAVKSINDDTSELTMSSEFVVKAGPAGWVMGKLVMEPMMKGVFKKLMSGLAYYTETGERIDSKLPAGEQMNRIVVSG
ncbi:SRPBCC family protein [Vibrio makurazakiensis]|uniref:SRPBCC family protein n=1 Tax=Vibrio makurazakiensis TaxID=2910250 RepID=UPI003D0EC816